MSKARPAAADVLLLQDTSPYMLIRRLEHAMTTKSSLWLTLNPLFYFAGYSIACWEFLFSLRNLQRAEVRPLSLAKHNYVKISPERMIMCSRQPVIQDGHTLNRNGAQPTTLHYGSAPSTALGGFSHGRP